MIVSFTFDSALRESFLGLGYELYRGDNFWIPPIKKDLRASLSSEFAFYNKPGNSFIHFLLIKERKPLGRISAMVNRDLHDRDGTPVGIVGFFECIDDYSAASSLLDAAISWLNKEMGLHRIWGPMNFDIWHSYRFMTEGFDTAPFYGEPYNKPYYPEYFLRYGFTAKYHWDSVAVTGRENLNQMVQRGIDRYREVIERGYRFENINKKKIKDELCKLHKLLSRAFQGFLGYTPISPEEFFSLFNKFHYAVDPRFFCFVYDGNNSPVGFAGALFELSGAIRSMSGKDDITSRVRFLYKRCHISRINFYILGMIPEACARGTGLGRAGFTHVLGNIVDAGYETVLFTLMARGNMAAQGLVGNPNVLFKREYALFEWNA